MPTFWPLICTEGVKAAEQVWPGQNQEQESMQMAVAEQSPAGAWYMSLRHKSDGLAAWRGVDVVKSGHCQRSCGDAVTWTR